MLTREKKTTILSDARCFSLWGDSNVGWIHNEGVNGVGSLLTMWHKDVFCCGGKGFYSTIRSAC